MAISGRQKEEVMKIEMKMDVNWHATGDPYEELNMRPVINSFDCFKHRNRKDK